MESIDLHDSTLCRTCLKKASQTTSVFDELQCYDDYSMLLMEQDLRIADLIVACSSVSKIDACDGMPQQICVYCVEKLRSAYQFQRTIEESEVVLRSALNAAIDNKDDLHDYDELSGLEVKEESLLSFPVGVIRYNGDVEIKNEALLSIDETRIERLQVNEVKRETSSEENNALSPKKTSDIIKKRSHTASLFVRNRCIVCSKTFTGQIKLSKHLINKHAVRNDQSVFKPFQCDKCEKCYTTLANLSLHKVSHTGIKPFKCKICERSFYKELSLKNHMSIHTGVRKHQCDMCGRGFTSANILQQHRKTHATYRAYTCANCSKGFYTSNDLRIHFRTHTGEKPYLCSFCGRGFSRKTHLNIHLRTHSGEKPYKCETCDRAFAQSGDLTAHIRIHTGEKPYTCSVCNKSFNQTSGLRSHMKSHTDEKSHFCQICNKGFTQSSSLGRHIKAGCPKYILS